MFYLKYRPQKLAELDLKSVRERLAKAFSQKNVPHAFLFAGPRGTGKTSAARIVAKIVNCEARSGGLAIETESEIGDQRIKKSKQLEIKPTSPEGLKLGSHITDWASQTEPCDECDSCAAIKNGRHLDIFEIDAASNRGIDQIRDLRDKIALAPSSARYKVYIIDEVHMLTKEAFNALLKTLEEPPPHAIFILATTESYRLPETIKSRCMEIAFSKATKEEVRRSLSRVVRGEKIDISEDALSSIADMADGSFRDATKILEEISAGGGRIGTVNFEKYVGASFAQIDRFIKLLEKKKVGELLEFINKNVENGTDVSWLTKITLNKLHEAFLEKYGIGASFNRNKPAFAREELIRLMRLLEGAAKEERDTVVAQMPLELAIIEWCESKVEN